MSAMDPPSYEDVTAGGDYYVAGPAPGTSTSVIPAVLDDFPMGILPGYEEVMGADHDGMFEPPPPYTEPCVPTAPPPEIRMPPPYVSEDVARQVLMDYSKKRSFFSSKVAAEMELQKSQEFHTHRYRLETFTESRKSKWVFVPYYGENIDGPGDREIPKAWDVPVQVLQMFQDGKQKVRVPYTSTVQTCWVCRGNGKRRCSNCGGAGRTGTGRERTTCIRCGGSGSCRCSMCKGQRLLLKFMQLTVEWKNFTFVFIADHKSDFPSKRFKKVTGEVVFSDEQTRLFPVTGFPDPSINEASQTAISEHYSQSMSRKILSQKHSIEWLPLTKVEYIWKTKQYNFFVYGKENKVHAEQYLMGVSCAVM